MEVNKKFNFALAKKKNKLPYLDKFANYYPTQCRKYIWRTLQCEAENYVRKIHKIPDMFPVYTYTTTSGKVAVIELNTPKKRYLYKKADEASGWPNCNWEPLKEFRRKYGFIPKPINVLKRFVFYGYMTSQDVEHLYHSEPVDYKISEDLEDFRKAYSIHLDDKDVLVPRFNGYSCMSDEPEVGAFYYYFGAKIIVFYAKDTNDIVGRVIVWHHNGKDYISKGYVRSSHQVKASEVIEQLENEGLLFRGLPNNFCTTITSRLPDKTPSEALDMLEDKIRVPYIDEDLELSEDKTELSFSGCYSCKKTGCDTLHNFGNYYCAECGDAVDEDEAVEIDGEYYCDNCALYCHCCDEWFTPDAAGARNAYGDWICDCCLDSEYTYCNGCDEYCSNGDCKEVFDEDGDDIYMCSECIKKDCGHCSECNRIWVNEALKEVGKKTLCPDCLNKKEA